MRKIIFLAVIFFHAIAIAGAISGGGGKAVVCRDQNQAITSTQTLDLYEGRIIYGLNIPQSSAPYWQQVDQALKVSGDWMLHNEAYNIRDGLQMVRGSDLQPIDDDAAVAAPHGCKLEQVANYFTDRKILVNGDIWDMMSPTDQAALIVHEAVYKVDRMVGAKNSFRSRHVVAVLFDPSTKLEPVEQDLPQEDVYMCGSQDNGDQFTLYKNAQQKWVIQFHVLANQQVFSKKSCALGAYMDGLNTLLTPLLPGEDKVGPAIVGGASCRLSSKFEDQDSIDIEAHWENAKGDWGKPIPGYQMPAFTLSWWSRNYPVETYTYIRKPFTCGFVAKPGLTGR